MTEIISTFFSSFVDEDAEGNKKVILKIENELSDGSTSMICNVMLDYDSIVLSKKTPVTDENIHFFIQGKAIDIDTDTGEVW